MSRFYERVGIGLVTIHKNEDSMNIDGKMRRCVRRCLSFSIGGRTRRAEYIADVRSMSRVEYIRERDADWGVIYVSVGGVCVAVVHLVQLPNVVRHASGLVEICDVSKKVYRNRILSALDFFFLNKDFKLVQGMVCAFDRD